MSGVVTNAKVFSPWRKIIIIAFAVILVTPLHAQDDGDESIYALRTKVYIQIGDHYASLQENKKAADAYHHAAQLAKQHLPAKQQTEISQRLANVQEMDLAISNLKTLCNTEQENLEACLLLAKYLSWNNQPIAAAKVGRRALQIDNDNKDAIITQANALNWQGDAAASLSHYERILQSDNSFNLNLGYSRALLSSGNLDAAHINRSHISASNVIERLALKELDWELKRTASPRLHLTTVQYNDAYDIAYNLNYLGTDIPFANSWVNFRLGSGKSTDLFYDFDLEHIHVGGQTRLHERVQISALAGTSSYQNGEKNEVTTGEIKLTARLQQTRIQYLLSRELFYELPTALANDIVRLEHDFFLHYQATDRWNFNLEINSTDYSDDNHSTDGMVSALYTFYFGPPKLAIGAKLESLAFDRQSDGGYFDPDRMTTNKLLFSISKHKQRFSANLELFAGSQTISVFNTTQTNQIAGGYGALRYHLFKQAMIEFTWEGGHYALGRPFAYRYNLFTLKGYLYF